MELSGLFPCIHVAVSENIQGLFCYISLSFLIYSSQYSFRWKFFYFSYERKYGTRLFVSGLYHFAMMPPPVPLILLQVAAK